MMGNDLISRSALIADIRFVQSLINDESQWLNGYVTGLSAAIDSATDAPAVDAVEVVRCKDCKFFKYGDYCSEDKMEHSRCREDDFCSYGERRADDGMS